MKKLLTISAVVILTSSLGLYVFQRPNKQNLTSGGVSQCNTCFQKVAAPLTIPTYNTAMPNVPTTDPTVIDPDKPAEQVSPVQPDASADPTQATLPTTSAKDFNPITDTNPNIGDTSIVKQDGYSTQASN